jgi:hypothetical protein
MQVSDYARELDPRFAETVFLIQATDFERHKLWEEDGKATGWEQDAAGLLLRMGELDGRPVNVSLVWARLRGCLVLFWTPVSQVVDYAQIEAWFARHCKPPLWDQGRRLAETDAANFHMALHAIEERLGATQR